MSASRVFRPVLILRPKINRIPWIAVFEMPFCSSAPAKSKPSAIDFHSMCRGNCFLSNNSAISLFSCPLLLPSNALAMLASAIGKHLNCALWASGSWF